MAFRLKRTLVGRVSNLAEKVSYVACRLKRSLGEGWVWVTSRGG